MRKEIKAFFAVLISLMSISYVNAQQSGLSPDLQKIIWASHFVINNYVDTVNEKEFADEAIAAMLQSLDPHSSYIPKEEVEKANEGLRGDFDGIGVTFQMLEDTMVVMQTISGAPAEKVGIMAGDKIVSVDGENIVKMSTNEIQKRVRGPRGTDVNITVIRGGETGPLQFTITRDKIPLYSVDASYMIDNEVGYIKINRYARTTMDEYVEAFNKLSKQGMKYMIIDLQGNGGGFLNTAKDLVSMFVPDNSMVVYTEGTHQPRQEFRSSDRYFDGDGAMMAPAKRKEGQFRENVTTLADHKNRLVILVDENSASASEITAGALQDLDRAVIVGRRTFGKGLVQKPFKFADGSEMRLTIAKYYTPAGRCVQKPYEKNGKKDYAKDLSDRWARGEYMHEDSISFPDSLKYTTLYRERTIYGGGGIMPDVFVPLDTTYNTAYYRKVIGKGVLNKYCLKYVERNREKLNGKYDYEQEGSFAEFNKTFVVTDDMLEDMLKQADEAKIERDEDQIKRSREHMKINIKALIASDLWGRGTYYEIMNTQSDVVKKAVEIIKDPKLYKESFVDRKSKAKEDGKKDKKKK